MKNFLFLVVFALLSVAGFGQRFENFKTSTGALTDTVTNATSKSLSSPLISNYYDMIAFQVTANRVSGTAGGNVYLQGSLDGSNWINIDTVAITNVAAQNHLITLEKYPWAYLRTTYTGSGTMVVVFKTRALYKRKG